MAIRKIITPPNPALRARAKKVKAFKSELHQLIEDMFETLRDASGVGLAAPQVEVSQRVIVVEVQEESEDPEAPPKPVKRYTIVNPEIVSKSTSRVTGNEACLSIPGYFGEVERYEWVKIRGLDRHGKPLKLKAQGWLARILQHEIDHLEGILFIDRATQVWKVVEGEEAEIPAAA